MASRVQERPAAELDLVIAIDCTGSMDRWIRAAKKSILAIVKRVRADHADASVRVGVVAYRDFCDGPARLEQLALTSDPAVVRTFIRKLRAFGGGDDPEDMAGAFQAVLAMDLTAPAKRLVVVADAPCHGSAFHSLDESEAHAQLSASGPDMCAQVRELARRGIDVTFLAVNPSATAAMTSILEREYNATLHGLAKCGSSAAITGGHEFCTLPMDHHNRVAVATFSRAVSTAASSSLSTSKLTSTGLGRGYQATALAPINEDDGALSGGGCTSKATLVVDEATPMRALQWAELAGTPPMRAVRHSYRFKPKTNIGWAHWDLEHTAQPTTVHVLPTCFARGAMRSAHEMFDVGLERGLVAKFYSSQRHVTWLERDIMVQALARSLADDFSRHPEVRDGVDFVLAAWYEIEDPSAHGLSASMAALTAEPYLVGEFTKYNNNNGWVCAPTKPLNETAQGFSHFTWQSSVGRLLVVDLQGVGGISRTRRSTRPR